MAHSMTSCISINPAPTMVRVVHVADWTTKDFWLLPVEDRVKLGLLAVVPLLRIVIPCGGIFWITERWEFIFAVEVIPICLIPTLPVTSSITIFLVWFNCASFSFVEVSRKLEIRSNADLLLKTVLVWLVLFNCIAVSEIFLVSFCFSSFVLLDPSCCWEKRIGRSRPKECRMPQLYFAPSCSRTLSAIRRRSFRFGWCVDFDVFVCGFAKHRRH